MESKTSLIKKEVCKSAPREKIIIKIPPEAVKETDRLRKAEYTEGRVDGDDWEDEGGVKNQPAAALNSLLHEGTVIEEDEAAAHLHQH